MGNSSTAKKKADEPWLPEGSGEGTAFYMDWHKLAYVGGGMFGSVFEVTEVEDTDERAKLKTTKEVQIADAKILETDPACDYAVKIIRKQGNAKRGEFEMEFEVLEALQGKDYCLQLHKAYEDQYRIWLVLQNAKGGTFGTSQLFANAYRPWFTTKSSEQIARGIRYMHQLMTGMSELHKAGYTHNDGHGDNFMLSGDPDADGTFALIIDYGKCKKVKGGYKTQLAKTKPGSFGSDINSLASVITDMHPTDGKFTNAKLKELVKAMKKKEKLLELLIKDAVDGPSKFQGLFPAIEPGDVADYANKGGFRAGYSDDESGTGGSEMEEDSDSSDSDSDSGGGGSSRLRRLKRQNKKLMKQQRRLKKELHQIQRIIGKARRVADRD